jgi:bifunctional enzyme CysN/CysC
LQEGLKSFFLHREVAVQNAVYQKDLLRFITCGSVDDGKSTLIGRLLYDSKMVFDDQLAALASDSQRVGTQGANLDFALLVDGLAAEREQGITIDVATRFFHTAKRNFIVADTPGHEQYTRNMATGASTADVAVILIDARKGVLSQTKRHSFIVHLMGIKHVMVAVNKMDLQGYDASIFNRIEKDYRSFATALDFTTITCIPLSALTGENVLERSLQMPWYQGQTLLETLETVVVDDALPRQAFRMPVQLVNRPHSEFRGFSGLIASGTLTQGMPIRVLPSGKTSHVKEIWQGDATTHSTAIAKQSVTVTLTDEIDISRGDVLCAADSPAEVTDQCEAHLIWMGDEPMLPSRPYLMKIGAKQCVVTITKLKYAININTLEHIPARTLALNEIGVCNLSAEHPFVFDPFATIPAMGSFILIDRASNHTVGAGMIHFALRRAANIHWQSLDVQKKQRAEIKHQTPRVVWLTGLSGAGKSTIANLVEKKLHFLGKHTIILDGDNIRHGLNRDLGFTDAERVENIRRVAEVAKLMVEAGLIVIVSFISPFAAERKMARELFAEGEFGEVFVDAPLHMAESRDSKGLYQKARRGEIQHFTGISSPYEAPAAPEIHIHADQMLAEDAAEKIVEWLLYTHHPLKLGG